MIAGIISLFAVVSLEVVVLSIILVLLLDDLSVVGLRGGACDVLMSLIGGFKLSRWAMMDVTRSSGLMLDKVLSVMGLFICFCMFLNVARRASMDKPLIELSRVAARIVLMGLLRRVSRTDDALVRI